MDTRNPICGNHRGPRKGGGVGNWSTCMTDFWPSRFPGSAFLNMMVNSAIQRKSDLLRSIVSDDLPLIQVRGRANFMASSVTRPVRQNNERYPLNDSCLLSILFWSFERPFMAALPLLCAASVEHHSPSLLTRIDTIKCCAQLHRAAYAPILSVKLDAL